MAILYIVAALAAAGPSPSVTQPATVPTSAQALAVSPATAAALARTVAPANVMIPMELEHARKAILSLPSVDADAEKKEREYPGIFAAVWTAVEPEARRFTEADFPPFLTALERLYAARLSEQEAQSLLTFYRSRTGQKLLNTMYDSFDAAPLFAEMAKSESSAIKGPQLQAVTDAAKAKAVRLIGPEDEVSLRALVAAMSLEKVKALGAETQELTLDWVNKEDPEGEEKLGKIMVTTIERYMIAHPAKK